MHATAAITEQYTLEKVVQAENGGTVRLNVHLPRLESDSADAARINAEIARYYEYDVQEYADCPEAADPESWDICIEMNWNAAGTATASALWSAAATAVRMRPSTTLVLRL